MIPRSVGIQVMTRSPAERGYFGRLRCSEPWRHSGLAGSQMSKVCVPGGQVPLRTLLLTSRYLSHYRESRTTASDICAARRPGHSHQPFWGRMAV
jgi:hypothetical protein